jgi:uncharacterized integral membrane protein
MRIETIKAWMLVGFGLLIIGMLLYVFAVIAGRQIRLVYFGIGVVLNHYA